MSASIPRSVDLALQLSDLFAPEFVHAEGESVCVAPGDTGEVSKLLRFAHDQGISVHARGGGTKAGWHIAVDAQITLSTRRLDAVREHTWQDMTCTVEAGCTWGEMQRSLARYGQFVALDPLWPEQATVGGVISTNDSGVLRHRYGSLRDLIIGMTIALADGTVAKTGGKVVKNVAGYDLHKLMTGAFGTLAVITEVTFRLHAIAQHTRSLTVSSEAAEPLGDLLLMLMDSHLSTQAIQMRAAREGFHLDVRLAALPDVLISQADTVVSMAKRCALSAGAPDPEAWQAREAQIASAGKEGFVFKATMLPSEIPIMSRALQARGGSSVTQATGVCIGAFPGAAQMDLVSFRTQIEAAGGSLTILAQPAGSTADRWGRLPGGVSLMREIKHRFDPKKILNPGCFVGGI